MDLGRILAGLLHWKPRESSDQVSYAVEAETAS